MNKLFVALIVASLGTILVPAETQAGRLAFDAAGNLFLSDGHSIFKYAPDGAKSTFTAGLRYPLDLCFDREGNLFVSDSGSNSIYKSTPDETKSTFATGLYSSFCSPRTTKRLDRGLRVCSALCALSTDQRLAGAPPPRWLFCGPLLWPMRLWPGSAAILQSVCNGTGFLGPNSR